uniref:Uncharacterized protein n=1 Tax=Romanomermis culicivorax TaxID=13658 RepID=A0A915HKX0_ROMCU
MRKYFAKIASSSSSNTNLHEQFGFQTFAGQQRARLCNWQGGKTTVPPALFKTEARMDIINVPSDKRSELFGKRMELSENDV